MFDFTSNYKITDLSTLHNFVYGGNGILTLFSTTTHIYHTYLFKKPINKHHYPDDVIFVYALHYQHDGTTKQFYIGMIEQGIFRLTRHSRFLSDTPIVKGARYIMKMMYNPTLKTSMELYHPGKCAVCGRTLTSDKSISLGYGPKCKGRIHGLQRT